MQIKINKKIYDFEQGQTVLEVCQKEGVFIPTLCYHGDLAPEGACRMCLVKTDKTGGLVTSCNTPAEHLMEVVTEDEEIKKAREINLELLWADHAGKCSQCRRSGNCELQKMAKEMKLDTKELVPNYGVFEKEDQLRTLKESLKNRVVDEANPSIARDSQYCIECRRCIKVCREVQAVGAYGMHHRAIQTRVGTPDQEPLDCIFCGQCSIQCPTAAITEKDDLSRLDEILEDESRLKIFQVAPSVRFTIGEEFGLEPGHFAQDQLPTALRKLGADYVFDTTFSADLTILEESAELIHRVEDLLAGKDTKLPMFTSCCPSWVLYLEKYWPEMIPHLSSAKSPQQMLGALLKTFFADQKKVNRENLASISVMPCTSKKFEAQREEMSRDGLQDVDLVVTTRELARALKKRFIKLPKLKKSEFDQSLGLYSGAGIIFGATGGVMEAALRTAYEKITSQDLPKLDFDKVRGLEGIKEATVTIPKGKGRPEPLEIKVAVAHQIHNAKKILELIKKGECDYHFVEVMACPGGCLGGGGQPIPTTSAVRQKRLEAIYKKDKNMPLRKSHDNPAIKKLYKDFLGEPGGELSEEFLHTSYTDRS